MQTTNDIKKYYNRFSKNKLIKDFYNINLRQRAIINFCMRFIPNGANILEVGCGVGIISKHLQKKAKNVVSTDISELNIEIAKLFCESSICDFKLLDLTEDASELKKFKKFDVILLADVIEHIPKEKHMDLFATIEKLLAPNGLVILTFPSAEYQEYIKQNNPNNLQVVDETLGLTDILTCTSLEPLYFSYCDIWGKNQYIHLVLKFEIIYTPIISQMSILKKIIHRIKNIWWRWNNYLFLRKIRNVL